MKKLMKKMFVCFFAALFPMVSACGSKEKTEAGSFSAEHAHSYTTSFVEPTKEAQDYTLHTCSCQHSYADGYTGIAGVKETEKPSYRILFIGNSYTYFNNLWNIFRAVAQGEGYEVQTDSVTQGGHTLQQMADVEDVFGARVEGALKTRKYDAVFLQEHSLRPVISPAAFYDAVRVLKEKMEENGAKGILYQTWGRKTGSGELGVYQLTNETMTMKLAAAYEAISDECGLYLSPVGSAFFEIEKNHAGIELYNADFSHPSPAGSYLAALCHYATVYGKSPVGVRYVCGVNTKEEAEVLQRAAHRAVFGASVVTEEYRCSSEGVTEKDGKSLTFYK